jgi:hypothetical protein
LSGSPLHLLFTPFATLTGKSLQRLSHVYTAWIVSFPLVSLSQVCFTHMTPLNLPCWRSLLTFMLLSLWQPSALFWWF